MAHGLRKVSPFLSLATLNEIGIYDTLSTISIKLIDAVLLTLQLLLKCLLIREHLALIDSAKWKCYQDARVSVRACVRVRYIF